MKCRCLQFSLRSMLAAFALACVFIGRELDYYRRQNEAIRQLTQVGAAVLIRRQVPQWLFNLSGGRCRHVYAVNHETYWDAEPSITLEDAGFAPSEDVSDIELYFLFSGAKGQKAMRHARIEEIVPAISKCDGCQVLRLSGLAVKDDHLRAFRSLGKLQVLYLDDTQVSDAGLEQLRGLKHLRSLKVSGTQVSIRGAEELAVARPGLEIDILLNSEEPRGVVRTASMKRN